MALAATEASLDKLQQQVGNCQVGIGAACVRLENTIQTLCRDDTTRPFLTLLPKILSMLFGDDQQTTGWVESAGDHGSIEALYNLLHPSGVLFQACLSYSCREGIAPFDLATSQLPVLTLLSPLLMLS